MEATKTKTKKKRVSNKWTAISFDWYWVAGNANKKYTIETNKKHHFEIDR